MSTDTHLFENQELGPGKTETGKKWEGKGRKIESIQEELTLIQSLENKYILFSILFQILGLVTLLILFRVLLKDN